MDEFHKMRGLLIAELHRQHSERKYLPQKLKEIIRESGIDAEKKKDFDEIIVRFNKDLLRARGKGGLDIIDIGSYYLDLSGCEGLFDAVDDDRIMSEKEFDNLESEKAIIDAFEMQKTLIMSWERRFLDALPLYAAIDGEQLMHDVFFGMLEYKAKEHHGSKINFICQLLKAREASKDVA